MPGTYHIIKNYNMVVVIIQHNTQKITPHKNNENNAWLTVKQPDPKYGCDAGTVTSTSEHYDRVEVTEHGGHGKGTRLL